MGETSLRNNVLILDDTQFTKENLQSITSGNSSISIKNLKNGETYYTDKTSFVVFNKGKLDKTEVLKTDEEGNTYLQPTKDVVVLFLEGVDCKNWGDYNWNLHSSDISYLLDYKDYESTLPNIDNSLSYKAYESTLTDIDTSISYKTYQGTVEDVTVDPDAKPFIYEESLSNISTSINYKIYQPNIDNILISTSYKDYQSTLSDVSFSTSTQ